MAETTHTFTAMAPQYYWRVRARNSLGQVSNWANDEVAIAAPAAPTHTSASVVPNENQYRVNLYWDKVSETTDYIAQVSTNSGFTEDLQEFPFEGAEHTLDLALGKYYWRVKALNSLAMESGWSKIQNLTAGLFSWRFGWSGDDYGGDFVLTEHGIIVAGKKRDALSHYDIVLLNLDLNGNKLWEKILGGPDDDYLRSVNIAAHEGFLVSGRSYSSNEQTNQTNNYPQDWITKLNINGEEEWRSSLLPPNGALNVDYINPQITNVNRSLWLRSSQIEVDGAMNYDLMELDKDGTELSVTELPAPDLNSNEYIIVENWLKTPDGTLITNGISGPEDSIESAYWKVDGLTYVQRIDMDGTPGWAAVAPHHVPFGAFIRQLSGGSILLGGETENSDLCFSKHSFDGTLEEANCISHSPSLSIDGRNSVVVTDSGFSVLANQISAPWALALLHFDNDLNELSQQYFHELTGTIRERKITQTPDGGFLILGEHKDATDKDYDMFLLKTDAKGNYVPLEQLDLGE